MNDVTGSSNQKVSQDTIDVVCAGGGSQSERDAVWNYIVGLHRDLDDLQRELVDLKVAYDCATETNLAQAAKLRAGHEPPSALAMQQVMVGSINYETPVMVAREVEWLRDELRQTQTALRKLEDSAQPPDPDARRYQRLRILGCAPLGSPLLAQSLVMRFQSLDEFLDADITAHPSRGEASYSGSTKAVAP